MGKEVERGRKRSVLEVGTMCEVAIGTQDWNTRLEHKTDPKHIQHRKPDTHPRLTKIEKGKQNQQILQKLWPFHPCRFENGQHLKVINPNADERNVKIFLTQHKTTNHD